MENKEIQDLVNSVNKRIKRMQNVKNVYLAGKISKEDWRQQLVDIRNNFFGCEKDKIRNYQTLFYNDYIRITGPFFLSCDHSCYHGNNSHGVGLNNYLPDGSRYDCYAETNHFTEDEVKEICLNQIKHSDIIFAYINSNECYGTLFELGYAASLGKQILILFDLPQRMKDMWFITKGADIVKLQKVYKEYTVKQHFDEMINELLDKNEKSNK